MDGYIYIFIYLFIYLLFIYLICIQHVYMYTTCVYIYIRVLVYPGVPFLYNWDFAEFFSHNKYLTILYEAQKTHGVVTISKAHHGPSHLQAEAGGPTGSSEDLSCAATVLIGPLPSISSMRKIDLY